MTIPPGSGRLIKGGIVLLDPARGDILRVISLQYNPDSLQRTLQAQTAGSESGDRSDAVRIKGPPVETLRIEAEIDAADQLALPDSFPNAAELGIHPQLAALETMLYPSSDALRANRRISNAGTLEILPVEAPLTLFVWSERRIVPVRITEFSITEEAFDTRLNPIRAKVTLAMRVLTVNDVGFEHRGGGIFMKYLQAKEDLARKAPSPDLRTLGIRGIP
jgi:hypothetical protein